jgi:hypothetical protein
MNRYVSTLLVAATVGLASCSGLRSVSSEVSSYGDWPAQRKPGSYAFERLPSQQARAEEAEALEAAARPALEKAGFKAAEAGKEPDVLVQLGARDLRLRMQVWDDPLWWRGGFGPTRRGPWVSPRWALYGPYDQVRYVRSVALLMRDHASNKPLFEAHAGSEGNLRSDAELLGAMFDAALMDFPKTGINPRQVVVTLP